METIKSNYRQISADKSFFKKLLMGVILFLTSMLLSTFADSYVKSAELTVTRDLILDNIPVFRVGGLFFGGTVILILSAIFIGIHNPRKIPFLLISSAMFFAIRSFFIILTHLAPPNVEYYQYMRSENNIKSVMFSLSSGADMFFSGHTGYPFLLALISWNDKIARYIFISFSILMAITVLLGHLHYSIDVFSAYFITYGIYIICLKLFKKEAISALQF